MNPFPELEKSEWDLTHESAAPSGMKGLTTLVLNLSSPPKIKRKKDGLLARPWRSLNA